MKREGFHERFEGPPPECARLRTVAQLSNSEIVQLVDRFVCVD
jgi:hypothetical protein